jgi:hypothetical protein
MRKIILLFGLSVLIFTGNAKDLKYDWQSVDLGQVKIYMKNNEDSAMGQFGIVKYKDVCTFTTFYIAISGYDKNLLKFNRKNISFLFIANNTQVNISARAVVYNVDKKLGIYQIISSNFMPTEKFLNLLKNSKRLIIMVNKYDKIYKYLDTGIFIYDLKGFKYILDLGYSECKKNKGAKG